MAKATIVRFKKNEVFCNNAPVFEADEKDHIIMVMSF